MYAFVSLSISMYVFNVQHYVICLEAKLLIYALVLRVLKCEELLLLHFVNSIENHLNILLAFAASITGVSISCNG